MDQNKKEIVYKIVLDRKPITKETLLKYGLTEVDITILIRMRVIEYISENNYKLVSIEKLRHYGVKQLLAGNKIDANICFEICYQLAPNGRNINLQYLLLEIIKHDYQKAFEIYTNLEKLHPEKYDKDYNLYLYLLSFITEFSQVYKDRIKKFTLQDLMLPSRGGNEKENEIRDAIYKNKFKYAYKKINSMISRDREYSVKYELIRALIGQVIEVETKFKESLLYLSIVKNYPKILLILSKKAEQSKLSQMERYILLIVNEIVKIIQTQTIPQITKNDSCDLYEALKNNDFKLALALNEEFLESKQEDKNKDIINILLVEINKLILSIEFKHKVTNQETIPVPSFDKMAEKQNNINKLDIASIIKESEELAYYINSQNITIEVARKQIGLFPEQIQLIKLIYVRDYYIERNYAEGDRLLQEVEESQNKTSKVMILLNEIKNNKDNYQSLLKLKTLAKIHQ